MIARAYKPLPLCSSTPENLLVSVEITGALGNERNPLSKHIIYFQKMHVEQLRNSESQSLTKLMPLCLAPLKNLVLGITGALEMKETHFLSKIYFQKMQWSNSETVNARAFKPLPLCSSTPEKLTSRDYWSSRNERNPLSKQNIFLENAVE